MTVNELVEGAPVGILVTSQVLGVHYVWKQVQGAELVVPIKEGSMLVTLSLVPGVTGAVGILAPVGIVSPVQQFVFV